MISVVIPLFNEEENVHHLYQRLTAASPSWEDEYEIIFVDDGSYDDTLLHLKELSKGDSRIKAIKLSRNFGHQAAITAGIKHAKGDAVVVMDGDLQDPPEKLSLFLNKWREGYHVVYAVRTKRKEGFFKKICYKVFYRLLKMVSDINIPLDSGDFCVMDKKVVRVLNTEMIEHARFVRGLRAYAGFKQVGVAYERDKRAAGEVKYTFKKLMKLAIDGLLDFATFPLKLATYIGFIIAIPSFIAGFFFVIHRIFNFRFLGYTPADTPGLASLAVGVFFLGGVILIILGIMGEYIGRIYFEVKRRPFYIIDEIYNEQATDKTADRDNRHPVINSADLAYRKEI
jgi:glycosyltransferase involved in cell wall biosynthesis